MNQPALPVSAPHDPLESLADTLFHPMGSDGVYARTALYEDVIERLTAYITRQRDPRAEVLRFPPVMSRHQLEKSGYLKSFPNLLGCVCALHGSEALAAVVGKAHRNVAVFEADQVRHRILSTANIASRCFGVRLFVDLLHAYSRP